MSQFLIFSRQKYRRTDRRKSEYPDVVIDAAGLNKKNMKKHGGRAGGNKDFCSASKHKAVAT